MISSTRTMATYAAAGLVVVVALAEIVPPMLASENATACSERYANTALFRLERDGTLLTRHEMQARVAGHRSVGVRDNMEIMKPKEARIPAAMQVGLRSSPGNQDQSAQNNAGIAFPWPTRSVQKQTSACLTCGARRA